MAVGSCGSISTGMETITVTFELDSNNYTVPLGFSVVYRDQVLVNIDHVESKHAIKFDLDFVNGDHELQFIMKNKTIDDTVVDDSGNIVTDACLTITDVYIDNINFSNILYENSIYQHDFNGSQDKVEDEFYGTMGCNGTVTVAFSSPFYIWLLELSEF